MIESVFVYKPSVSSLTVTESRVVLANELIILAWCPVMCSGSPGSEVKLIIEVVLTLMNVCES